MAIVCCCITAANCERGAWAGQVELGWIKYCGALLLSKDCWTVFKVWDEQTGQLIIDISVMENAPNGPLIQLRLPAGVSLETGATIIVDGTRSLRLRGSEEDPLASHFTASLSDDQLSVLRKGREAQIRATRLSDQKSVEYTVPLDNFEAWYASVGVTTREYRRQEREAQRNAGNDEWRKDDEQATPPP